MRALVSAFLGLLLAPASAGAQSDPCTRLIHEDHAYTVCEAIAGRDELRLWLRGRDGAVLGTFERLEAKLRSEDTEAAFAMNAGMYHPDRRPVGLHVEDGAEITPLVMRRGPGNFGMLPNGVLCIRHDTFAILESRRFAEIAPRCRHATQSGPMLVIDGALHPRFIPDSDSRYIRNGVGVSADGRQAWFAISERPVNFHDFARLFRDQLGVPQALYFDGNVSRLHAPGLGRSDGGRPMGPIIGMVREAGEAAR